MSTAEITNSLRQKDIEKTLALEEIKNAEVKDAVLWQPEHQMPDLNLLNSNYAGFPRKRFRGKTLRQPCWRPRV
jgi:hypothetical protein